MVLGKKEKKKSTGRERLHVVKRVLGRNSFVFQPFGTPPKTVFQPARTHLSMVFQPFRTSPQTDVQLAGIPPINSISNLRNPPSNGCSTCGNPPLNDISTLRNSPSNGCSTRESGVPRDCESFDPRECEPYVPRKNSLSPFYFSKPILLTFIVICFGPNPVLATFVGLKDSEIG